VENREEDGKNINIVTRGGAKTREDVARRIRTSTNGSGIIQHPNKSLMSEKRKKYSRNIDMRS
jgi:hypothetical protein